MTTSGGAAGALQGEKDRVRRLILKERRGLGPAWAEAASLRLQERVLALEVWRAARRAAVYIALRGEAGTDRLVQECRACGRAVAVPAMRAQGDYGFVWWQEGDVMEGGPLGTREPAAKRWLSPGELDVVIVPALAYDAAGRRLGHGGGYYDRLLAAGGAGAGALKVGLGFGFQVLERIPAGEQDICVDWVVTEENVISCSRSAARERGAT
jgi:5-formyltetrahydrofolate cyclo-ligase